MCRYLILILLIFIGCHNEEINKARREILEAQYKPVSDWVETLVYRQKIKPKVGFYRSQEFELVKILKHHAFSKYQYRDVKILVFESDGGDLSLELIDSEAYGMFTGKELNCD